MVWEEGKPFRSCPSVWGLPNPLGAGYPAPKFSLTASPNFAAGRPAPKGVGWKVRNGHGTLLPKWGGESPKSHLQKTELPKGNRSPTEVRGTHGPEVALGPLPSARLRLCNSPCGVVSPKSLDKLSGFYFCRFLRTFWERTFEVRFPHLT